LSDTTHSFAFHLGSQRLKIVKVKLPPLSDRPGPLQHAQNVPRPDLGSAAPFNLRKEDNTWEGSGTEHWPTQCKRTLDIRVCTRTFEACFVLLFDLFGVHDAKSSDRSMGLHLNLHEFDMYAL